jgi:hypothetical protein
VLPIKESEKPLNFEHFFFKKKIEHKPNQESVQAQWKVVKLDKKKIEKHAGKEMEEKEKHITRLFQI